MSNKKDIVFKPTKSQIKLITVLLDDSIEPTITATCKAIGINRSTYYRWMDSPEFVAWFNQAWDIAMARQVPWLDKIGYLKSPDDFRYWEALQMKYGKFKRKQETDVNVLGDELVAQQEALLQNMRKLVNSVNKKDANTNKSKTTNSKPAKAKTGSKGGNKGSN